MASQKPTTAGSRPRLLLSPWLVSFASGFAAGCADTLINYPPYCLHYRWQRYEDLARRSIYTPRELYRGVTAYSAIVPITCLCDGLTDALVAREVPRHFAAIGAGMLAATTISAPIGNAIVVNLRLREAGKPAGSMAAMRHIHGTYGWQGFYAGVQSLMLREAIYSWSVFYAKGAVQDRLGVGDVTSSVIAGTLATALSQPCDTSATRAQNLIVRQSWWTTVSTMWHEGGLRPFYRGFVFRWYAVIAGVYVMDQVSTGVKGALAPRE